MLYYHRTSRCLSRVSQPVVKNSRHQRYSRCPSVSFSVFQSVCLTVVFLQGQLLWLKCILNALWRFDSQTIKLSGNSLLSISSLEYIIVIHVYALLEACMLCHHTTSLPPFCMWNDKHYTMDKVVDIHLTHLCSMPNTEEVN